MIWEKQKNGEWVGIENRPESLASITRYAPNLWRVDVRIVGNKYKSTWTVLASVRSAKRYAERFIDKHTW